MLNLSFKLSGGMLFSQAGQESLLGNGHVSSSHLGFIWGGGSFQVATSYFLAQWTPHWREELCYELAI